MLSRLQMGCDGLTPACYNTETLMVTKQMQIDVKCAVECILYTH